MNRDSDDAGEGELGNTATMLVARAQLTARGLSGHHSRAAHGGAAPPRDRLCCHSPGGRMAG